MATASTKPVRGIEYPTSDGRPMAETDLHRDLMMDAIGQLKVWFAADMMTYVSGNLLVFYQQGNRRKHVAPDVFVVRGVAKHDRLYYLVWEEGKGLDAAIELTSKSTRKEDLDKKFKLYRDVLGVREYFLCDPKSEYLKPPLQGWRLANGDYVAIEPIDGRLPSEVLGLHLEREGTQLWFWNPVTATWLPTPEEALRQAELDRDREIEGRRKAEEELARLRRQMADAQRGQRPTEP